MKVARRTIGGLRAATKVEYKPSRVNPDEAKARMAFFSERTKSRFAKSLALLPTISSSGDSGSLAGPAIRHPTSGQVTKSK